MSKLVRDRLQEFFSSPAITHVADDEEYLRRLRDKLVEEANEFRAEPCHEELADVLEVIEAILQAEGWDVEDIVRVKNEKADRRGRFEKRLVLDDD